VAGTGDFTTAGGGILEVVAEYGAQAPDNPITTRYLPILRTLANDVSPSVTDLAGFPEAWQDASSVPAFRQAQDLVMQRRYYDPALAEAERLGITRPLDVAILYDSLIQHGTGDDPDGFGAIVARVNERVGRPASADRHAWLSKFLDVRASVLAHPSDTQHVVAWPQTVERTNVLTALLNAGADDLIAPLTVTAYGSSRRQSTHLNRSRRLRRRRSRRPRRHRRSGCTFRASPARRGCA
jgi:chitosanase